MADRPSPLGIAMRGEGSWTFEVARQGSPDLDGFRCHFIHTHVGTAPLSVEKVSVVDQHIYYLYVYMINLCYALHTKT